MLRVGADLVEISRLEQAITRHGERFLARIYTPGEREECAGQLSSLAARWAAKEAVAKALGTGIGVVAFREIEVRRGPQREPHLYLHGNAAALAAQLGLSEWAISLSHTAQYAIAMVAAH
ncbi:MAG: holo-ACP synthase [Anaerolineales bacterium]